MVSKENLAPTAASKKRSSFAIISPPIKSKRIALAELPALPNIADDLTTRSLARKREQSRRKPLPLPLPDEDDPQLCVPYAADILGYLRSMEKEERRRPLINYMEKVQMKNVSPSMRGILVDWLVEVADEYKLVSDSLYLAVSYVDRFLSFSSVEKKRLQLLGVSCVLVASKYEEIEPPNVKDLCYITENTYTKKEVVEMEASILKFLRFEMGNPTAITFLRSFMKAGVENKKTELLAYYLAELSLLDYDFIRFLPSMVAASVLFLARFTMKPNSHPWSSIMQQYTGYSSSDLRECISMLRDLQLKRKCSSLMAIRDKYKQNKFKAVSAIVAHSEIPSLYFEDYK